MQKLNAHGKLVLGLIVALTAALPLACGSDDSKGVPNEEGGAGGDGGAAGKGGAASAGKGGAGKAGSTAAGAGGAPEAGAPEMGGEAGAPEAMGGAGGVADAAGAGGVADAAGAGGDVGDPVYEANLDAACTTMGSLNCSTQGVDSNKQDCIDLYNGLAAAYPPCVPQQKAFIACLAPKPAAAFECSTGDYPMASPKIDTCADAVNAYGGCIAVQP